MKKEQALNSQNIWLVMHLNIHGLKEANSKIYQTVRTDFRSNKWFISIP
ncbi:hypothetical protein DAQ1742_02608 [Dickeya aquatica]|uniref:Uncharacterized protein n=1 Tax=Dickeya aquatica TaxID=1401087 RepID=A0A375AC01_9GAMM|nr:hypothetical protein DAQ1742_02608 [Dickeya aquatica]